MILDIVIILFILAGAFFGFRKGIIGIAVSLISVVLAIILGYVLQAPIADMLYKDTGLGTIVEETVKNNINIGNNEEKSENTIYDNILNSIIGEKQEELTIEQAAKVVTMFILRGLSFVLIVIIVFIICYIVQLVLNLVFNIPVLSSINKIAGIAAGVIKSLLSIYILLAVIYFLAPIPFMDTVINYINNTAVAKVLYSNNFLVAILSSTFKI